jgi:hypothetical protein
LPVLLDGWQPNRGSRVVPHRRPIPQHAVIERPLVLLPKKESTMVISTDISRFTVEQLDEFIREREAAAALLPPGKIRQAIFVEITRLRSEALVKHAHDAGPQTTSIICGGTNPA